MKWLRSMVGMLRSHNLVGHVTLDRCHDFYLLRVSAIGDINDSVFHYPYFLLFMGPFLST